MAEVYNLKSWLSNLFKSAKNLFLMSNIEIYKKKVNNALKEFLERKLKEDGKYSNEINRLIENIIEFNLRGGKRIRPLITIFAYKCFRDDDKIINSSIFSELMQAYLLIHDDIMDKSDLRRGKASIHKIYEKANNQDFGVNMAILAGNLCASYAYDSIIESDFDTIKKIEVLKEINWINSRENYGQALDIIPGFENLNEEDVLKIYELKTATYTVQGPLKIGLALAGAPKDLIQKFDSYSYNLGIAFQIQDDLNSIFSNVNKLGKPNDSDIKEGKKTLIIAKALELCSKEDRDFLLAEYGNRNITPNSILKVREIMKKSSYEYCKNKLYELVHNAKKSIADMELKKDGKNFLTEIADYIQCLV